MKLCYRLAAAIVIAGLSLSACGGGGTGGPPPVVITPTPTPAQTQPPPPAASDACPTSASTSSVAAHAVNLQSAQRAPAVPNGASRFVPGLITVSYEPFATGTRLPDALARLHASPVSESTFESLGVQTRTVAVDPARVSDAIAQLRQTPGVRTVEQAQYRREMSVVAANDPYYRGLGGTGSPYYETSTVPGEWDMHAINVGQAWGYYASVPVIGAPIAIVDTGVDVSHPDLAGGRFARTQCYVTYPTNAGQTTGPYITDYDGHGTNVAGIADADTNNSYGFVGVAYDAPLLAYRIFPKPPSTPCEDPSNKNNHQCETTDVDEASAINDAVAHGARVINLSLGAVGPLASCTDTLEKNAVESAIAKGVVVVAAAGNETANSLDCPAAYPGVIAVGASALEGSGNTVSEGVASYSNYTSAAGPGGGGIYLVAPGGDPPSTETCATCTINYLHWILHIYSSTGVGASCPIDAAGEVGDCQTLIAGTSQATPHVVGVVSLMLGLKPSLSPAQIASYLCSTAHDIGDSKQGCGRVDAAAAVARASQ